MMGAGALMDEWTDGCGGPGTNSQGGGSDIRDCQYQQRQTAASQRLVCWLPHSLELFINLSFKRRMQWSFCTRPLWPNISFIFNHFDWVSWGLGGIFVSKYCTTDTQFNCSIFHHLIYLRWRPLKAVDNRENAWYCAILLSGQRSIWS